MTLTDEQLEAAAKALYCTENMVNTVGTTHAHSWERAAIDRDGYRKMAHAAAPFLQVPWEMPTRKEEIQCADLGQIYEQGMSGINHGATGILRVFVMRRNASLIPQPVDQRREKVFRTLLCNVAGPHDLQVVTDRILAALDAKE